MKTIIIDGKSLTTEDAFHDRFASAFRFPDYYGRNMNAWIDCMTDHCPSHGFISIHIENVSILKTEAQQLFESLVDCCAFINWRETSEGGAPLVALAYFK
jgi:RNAse (barnase) inhibitor barstar